MSMVSRWTIGAMASKKASSSSPVSVADRGRERRRGQGAGGDDDAVPVLRRQAGDFAALDCDQRLGDDRRLDRGGKAVAVDRQRAAGRHLVGVGAAP